jgi:hypothetical protein
MSGSPDAVKGCSTISTAPLLSESDRPPYKFVLVKWYDACGSSSDGWKPMEELLALTPVPCYTSGFLIYDGATDEGVNYVLICPHLIGTYDPDNEGKLIYDQGDGEIAIPRSWIVDIVYLD